MPEQRAGSLSQQVVRSWNEFSHLEGAARGRVIVFGPLAQPAPVEGTRLRAQNRHQYLGRPRQFRQLDIHDRCAELSQRLQNRFNRESGVLGYAFIKEVCALDTDPQPLDSSFKIRREVRYRLVHAACIRGVVPGNRLENGSAIFHGSGERSNVIERRSERNDTGAADPTIGRFETNDAVDGGRISDRTTGVSPDGREGRADRDGDGGT